MELAQSYESGLIQQTPIPRELPKVLEEVARSANETKIRLNTASEISHVFHKPALMQVGGDALAERVVAWRARVAGVEQQLADHQCQIDDIVFRLYSIGAEDRVAIGKSVGQPSSPSAEGEETEDDAELEIENAPTDRRQLTAGVISYAVGCAFGRWDVRFATGELPAPDLPDPFAPLPVCAPGALTGADGIPLSVTPEGYRLIVHADGILVDDPRHTDDLIAQVRGVFELVWPKQAEAREREACEMLGIKDLRDYFRKSAAGGFWTDHVKRYSKSRRKAPIYWLLRSSKGSYSIWIYYHRFGKDILYKALLNYVEPKIRLEENNLDQLRSQRDAVGTAGREAKLVEKQFDKQESFLSELLDFRDKLKHAADLHLEPELNDGVILNIAPLWEMVPWIEAKKCWDELLEGKYEWSSIGKQLRERGLVKS